MSGFFSIYNRNGNPVVAETVDSMLDGISWWQPDDRGVWHSGEVALGHAMLWNSPQSKLEHLPAKENFTVVTMDARLDNREELAKHLGIADRFPDQIQDSEFIAYGYRKWGEDCPRYFIGDFAFVIWDKRKQHLFCARDHVGVKQFYFHLTDTLFVCANDLKALVAHPHIKKELNDEAVANYLVNGELISSELTFFKDVRKLSPAHSMTISNSDINKRCYWKLEDAPKVKLPDREAYAKHLFELLERAVYDRMRTAYPVAAHLSGGLDSSSIAVIAARKLRKKEERLLAFNWLHTPGENDDSAHYEWSNSRLVAEEEDIDHHYVSLTADDIYHYMGSRDLVYGDFLRFWYEYPVRENVRKREGRTILSGWGGDELATYHGQAYYADLFSRGKIINVLKELKARVSKPNKTYLRQMSGAFYHNICLIFAPRSIYHRMPRNRSFPNPLFPFVKKEFLPVVEKELEKPSVLTMQPQRTIRAHMLAYWRNGHLQSRIESWAAAAVPMRLEYSYPLLDKRIIEFVAGVPADCFVHKGTGRYLFRSAVSSLLPEKIVWANAKEERRRVERLASLTLSACKMFMREDEGFNIKHSDYIDHGKLQDSLEKLDIRSIGRKELLLLQDIEVSLSVLFPKELRRQVLGG
jgi:asparagine synthase (glutamine-hydrolysing)